MNHEILNQKAEAMLSPEEAEASRIRAKNKFQDRDPFDSFLDNIKENDERREATAEEKKIMDANLIKLGKIFKNSDLKWHLDGALNISLLKGEYIGIHKDVDISVEKFELRKLDNHLGKSGYGLFLSYSKNPGDPKSKKIMERVGADKFGEAQKDGFMIASIDKDGKIDEEENLNLIDVHIIERNSNGKPIGSNDTELPNEWFEARSIDFKGEKLNIAQPIKVAYYKLHGIRNYDKTDLKKLAETGELNLDDVNNLEKIFEEEFATTLPKIEAIFKPFEGKIDEKADSEEIFDFFIEELSKTRKIEEPDYPIIKELSKQLSRSTDKSSKTMAKLTYQIAEIEKRNNSRRDKIKEFRQWVKSSNN